MKRLAVILCTLFLGLGLCANGVSASRICMVVAPTNFTDQEYAVPRAVFERALASVTVASTTRGTAVGHDGLKVPVTTATAELRPEQFDAIVVVGGQGAMDSLASDAALLALLRSAAVQGKVVGAICLAPAVLARAGVLRNLPATCYPDARVIRLLTLNGAEYRPGSVVVSGRVVTASGPPAAEEFARRILEALGRQPG